MDTLAEVKAEIDRLRRELEASTTAMQLTLNYFDEPLKDARPSLIDMLRHRIIANAMTLRRAAITQVKA